MAFLQRSSRLVSKRLVPQARCLSSASSNLMETLRSYPQTQVTTLDNGIRVASETGTGQTATVGVWIDAGSRYETAENNGVAHFTEHMLFKGTPTRSRVQLETEVENLGAHLNAYTSREQTVFYSKCLKSDVGQSLDLLSDILQNSNFSEEAIEQERGVIRREMQEVNESLEEVIFDRLHESAFMGTALGRTILGPVENINSISRADIVDYVQTHYVAPRMVIAGAGIEHDVLVAEASKYFGSVPSTAPNGKEAYAEPAIYTGSDYRLREDSRPVAHVAYAFPIAGWYDADNFALSIIQTLIGSWSRGELGHAGVHSQSQLVSNVASTNCATSVSTFNTQYSDTGLFGIYATTNGSQGQYDMMRFLTRALTELCYNVDEAQLEEAKTLLKMTMLSHLDSTSTICEDIGRQTLLYGRRMHPTEFVARIDAVDANAVKQTAERYFYDRDHVLAAIGPIYELPDYNWIRRLSYWLRY